MVPFLTLALGLSQHAAEATSLVVVLPTAVVASIVLRRHGVGDLGTALRFGLVGAIGGMLGALLALMLPGSTLKLVFAIFRADRRPVGARWCAGVTGDAQALVDELAASIQARVLSGDIPTGTRLRQESLAAEFGVSRTPGPRGAPQAAGKRARRVPAAPGALVRGPTVREIREAYEVRVELEGLAAELAATRIRDEELVRLRRAQALFRHSVATLLEWRGSREPCTAPGGSALDEWIEGNDLFHLAIQEAAGNARLGSTLTDLHRSFPRDLTWISLEENTRLLDENVAQHEAILDAIERHDPVAARRCMVEHVRRAGELVTRRFEERSL